MDYAIKAAIGRNCAELIRFEGCKTMYGGKTVAAGDRIFLFDSERRRGRGLVARGRVTQSLPVAPEAGRKRQTPRVTLTVEITGRTEGLLGPSELKGFRDWADGRPETELNFKFYRQATDKIVGISEETAAFLDSFFAAEDKLPV